MMETWPDRRPAPSPDVLAVVETSQHLREESAAIRSRLTYEKKRLADAVRALVTELEPVTERAGTDQTR
jgi:hypothetical protein